jgi:hypothetical protein
MRPAVMGLAVMGLAVMGLASMRPSLGGQALLVGTKKKEEE